MKTLILFTIILTAAAHAAPRTSANYSIVSDTIDVTGQSGSSESYTHIGSAGGIVGVSALGAGNPFANFVKHGFLGQLYEVGNISFYADQHAQESIPTGQLYGYSQLDDGSYIFHPGSEIQWSVVSGPISSISAAGVMSGGIVGQDTPAVVRGVFAFFSGDVNVTVLNTIPDNFGTYAGDGLADAWQLEHFGSDNPLAAPLIDPDHDGQNNLFEFIAGLLPLDRTSRFLLRVEPVPGQVDRMRVIFSPRFADRTYTTKSSSTLLSDSWVPLVSPLIEDEGATRTLTDSIVPGGRRFYTIEIEKN